MSDPLELVGPLELAGPLDPPESFAETEALLCQLEDMKARRTFEGSGVSLAEVTEFVRACNAQVATRPRLECCHPDSPPLTLRMAVAELAYKYLKRVLQMHPEYLRRTLTPDVLHTLMVPLYTSPSFFAGVKHRPYRKDSVDVIVGMLQCPEFKDVTHQADIVVLLRWLLAPQCSFEVKDGAVGANNFVQALCDTADGNFLAVLRGFVTTFRHLETIFGRDGPPPPSERVGTMDFYNQLVWLPLLDAFALLVSVFRGEMSREEAETYTDAVCAAISSNLLVDAVVDYVRPLMNSAVGGCVWQECIQRTMQALVPRLYEILATQPKTGDLHRLIGYAETYKWKIGQAPWLLDILVKATKINALPSLSLCSFHAGRWCNSTGALCTQGACEDLASFALEEHRLRSSAKKNAQWVQVAMQCLNLELASPRESAKYLEEVLQRAYAVAESDKSEFKHRLGLLQPFTVFFAKEAISLALKVAEASEEDRLCSPELAGKVLVSAISLCFSWHANAMSIKNLDFVRLTSTNALAALFTAKGGPWALALAPFTTGQEGECPSPKTPTGEPLVPTHHLAPLAGVVMRTLTQFAAVEALKAAAASSAHLATALAWVPVLAGCCPLEEVFVTLCVIGKTLEPSVSYALPSNQVVQFRVTLDAVLGMLRGMRPEPTPTPTP